MQQIAVRAVQLERVDAEPVGALGRRDEGLANALQAGVIERQRRRFAFLVRDGRRPDRPPAAFGDRDQLPAVPRRWLEALRPAWASCIATAAFECLRTEARIGFSAASVASL